MLQLSYPLKLASLVSLYSLCVYNLRLLFMRLLCYFLFSQLCTNNISYLAGDRQRAVTAVNCVNNKVLLQPAYLEERLYLNLLIQRTYIALLYMLMLFLIMLLQPVLANCAELKAAVAIIPTLKSVQQFSQLFNRQPQQGRQFNILQRSNLLAAAVFYNCCPLFTYYSVLIAQIHVNILQFYSVLSINKYTVPLKIAEVLLHVIK